MSKLPRCGCGGCAMLQRVTFPCLHWVALCDTCSISTRPSSTPKEAMKLWEIAFGSQKLFTEEPGDNDFLIVEKGCTERYSKDAYLPTPVAKDSYLTPLNAEHDSYVRTWSETEKRPPTEADGGESGEILCINIYGDILNVPWKQVAENRKQYPRWKHTGEKAKEEP